MNKQNIYKKLKRLQPYLRINIFNLKNQNQNANKVKPNIFLEHNFLGKANHTLQNSRCDIPFIKKLNYYTPKIFLEHNFLGKANNTLQNSRCDIPLIKKLNYYTPHNFKGLLNQSSVFKYDCKQNYSPGNRKMHTMSRAVILSQKKELNFMFPLHNTIISNINTNCHHIKLRNAVLLNEQCPLVIDDQTKSPDDLRLRNSINTLDHGTMGDYLHSKNKRVIESLIETLLEANSIKGNLDEKDDVMVLYGEHYRDIGIENTKALSRVVKRQILQISSKPFSLNSRLWKSYLAAMNKLEKIKNKIVEVKKYNTSINELNLDGQLEAVHKRQNNLQYNTKSKEMEERNSSKLREEQSIIDEKIQDVTQKIKAYYWNLTYHINEYYINSEAPGITQKQPKSYSLPQDETYSSEGNSQRDIPQKDSKKTEKTETKNDDIKISTQTKNIPEKDSKKNEKTETKNDDVTLRTPTNPESNNSIYKKLNDLVILNEKETLNKIKYNEKITNQSEKSIYSDNNENKVQDKSQENLNQNLTSNIPVTVITDNKDLDLDSEFIEKYLLRMKENNILKENEKQMLDKLSEKFHFFTENYNKIKTMNKVMIEDDFQVNNTYQKKSIDSDDEAVLEDNKNINLSDDSDQTINTNTQKDFNYIINLKNDSALFLIDLVKKNKILNEVNKLKMCAEGLKINNDKLNAQAIDGNKNIIRNRNLDIINNLWHQSNDLKPIEINSFENEIMTNKVELMNIIRDTAKMHINSYMPDQKHNFNTHLKKITMKDEILRLHITIRIPYSSINTHLVTEKSKMAEARN